MSISDDIATGVQQATEALGEPFTLSNHSGSYSGIFRGETAPVSYEDIQGYQTAATDALTVSKSAFPPGNPPLIDELVTKTADNTRYTITQVEAGDLSCWDLSLTKRDV